MLEIKNSPKRERAKFRENDEEDDEEVDGENSSDDSFVKVIAFADHNEQDLGFDLSEFVKEVRLAPHELSSFNTENASDLGKQVCISKKHSWFKKNWFLFFINDGNPKNTFIIS